MDGFKCVFYLFLKVLLIGCNVLEYFFFFFDYESLTLIYVQKCKYFFKA